MVEVEVAAIQGAALHGAGALLWISVCHALRPRLAWSIPAGIVLSSIPVALLAGTWSLPSFIGASLGLAAAVVLAAGAALAVRGARRRRRRAHLLASTIPGALRAPSRRAVHPAPDAAPLSRLWRGQLPVWLGMVSLAVWLATLCWFLVVFGALPLHRHPRLVASTVVALWSAGPLGVATALVGIWRSVRADAPQAPPPPVAWLIRLGLLCGWLFLALITAVFAPDVLSEYGSLAFGRSQRELYSLRLLRGGREMEISGEMGFGLTEDVIATLAANPGVKLIHLNSPGGRVVEGDLLAAVVQERHLATYVAAECASACVTVLAAGEPRLIARHARIGLHRPRGIMDTPLDRADASRRMVRKLVSLGVDESFARRGANTPNGSIWWPSHDELVAARLVTRHAGGGEVALSGVALDDLDRLPLVLREEALFQALFEFERPAFERWTAALRRGYEQGLSEDEALRPLDDDIPALFERVVERDLPRASDTALRGFYQALIAGMRRDGRDGASRCASLLAGAGLARAVELHGDRSMADALAEVIASARLEPVAPVVLRPGEPALVRVVARVRARVPGWPAHDHAASTACVRLDGVVAMYEEILRLPPDQGNRLLRGVAGEKDDGEE